MNLNDYLNPPSISSFPEGEFGKEVVAGSHNNKVNALSYGDIVLIGLPGLRQDNILEFDGSADLIRKELYAFSKPDKINFNFYDSGDLKQGNDIRDTLYQLSNLLVSLREKGVFILLVGGSGIQNLGVLKGYERLRENYTYTIIEPRFSLTDFLEYDIINFQKLNYINLGSQAYYLTEKQVKWLDQNRYESIRLGNIRGKTELGEPILRSSEGCSLSVNVIKHSDAPAQKKPSPNGLYAEEACQLARYAGLSDNLSLFGVFDYYPSGDTGGVTARLIAQLLWFAIEGYQLRSPEHPYSNAHFQRFSVNFDDYRLIFYKSEQTSRWWMEIPVKGNSTNPVLPCSKADYDMACKQELPARWLHAYQKLNFGNDKA
jgi:arginase family enzyme